MRRLTILYAIAAVLVMGSLPPSAFAEKPKRGVVVAPQVPAGSVPISGEYWALIIGIDKYQHAPKLESAVKDAKGVRDVLATRYGFKKERITELFNEQATSINIQNALYQLGRQAGKDDSVFIYYAGHGQYDDEGRLGWWVPVEAQPKNPGTFIMDVSILNFVKGMKAKHVYLVADSCFSGTLFGTRALPPLNDHFFARLYAKPSRWGLTSGGTEPVADQGKNGHSIFAYHFINLLKENTDPYLVPSHIYDQLAPLIANNADQTPRSEPLKGAGDEGGQFVFRLASVPSSSMPRASEGGSSDEMTAMKKRLAEMERKLAEQSKAAQPPKPVEEARARPYEAPRQTGREITGKDGSPMVLVPEGEFLYGDNNQRLSLSVFYMDKYEVSTKLYAAFMQATSRAAPYKWNEASQVSDGDRPVIGVTWHDADAYCRQYGKRLPTEQEWEKAARGTDGRKYPWGNEEPTSRHAKYDQDGKASWNGYATLASVESYEAGKSPYGLYNMAGNVWEWTSSDYDSSRRVIRGGSWGGDADYLRATDRDGVTPGGRPTTLGFRCAQDAK